MGQVGQMGAGWCWGGTRAWQGTGRRGWGWRGSGWRGRGWRGRGKRGSGWRSRACTQRPRQVSELLMKQASSNAWPVTSDFLTRSLPARSTKCSLAWYCRTSRLRVRKVRDEVREHSTVGSVHLLLWPRLGSVPRPPIGLLVARLLLQTSEPAHPKASRASPRRQGRAVGAPKAESCGPATPLSCGAPHTAPPCHLPSTCGSCLVSTSRTRTECDREEESFMLVAVVTRLRLAASISASACEGVRGTV